MSLDAPIRVDLPVDAHAGFELASRPRPRRRDAALPERLVRAARRRRPDAVQRPGPRRAPATCSRSHTFTRLFAPPGQRRVVSQLEVEGFPAVPHARYEGGAGRHRGGRAPAGTRWLDEFSPDLGRGRVHARPDRLNSVEAVNSLVYVASSSTPCSAASPSPAARSPSSRARSTPPTASPCLRGERVRAHLRLFGQVDTAAVLLGAAGTIAGPGEEDRPRCPSGPWSARRSRVAGPWPSGRALAHTAPTGPLRERRPARGGIWRAASSRCVDGEHA